MKFLFKWQLYKGGEKDHDAFGNVLEPSDEIYKFNVESEVWELAGWDESDVHLKQNKKTDSPCESWFRFVLIFALRSYEDEKITTCSQSGQIGRCDWFLSTTRNKRGKAHAKSPPSYEFFK